MCFYALRLALLGAWLAVAACGPTAPATAPSGASAPPAAAASPAAAPTAGSFDSPAWQELIAAARQEGKLVLASGPTPATRQNLPRAFKERFGVDVEYLGGRSSDLANRLENERQAGVYSMDAIIGGGDTVIRMYDSRWFDPIRPLLLPEVADPSGWRGNRLPFLDPEDAYLMELEGSVTGVVAINTQMVSEGEIRTFDDLLNPKWKGKISAEDPTTAGSGQNRAIYIYVLKSDEYFKQLYVDQQPAFSRDTRQIADWLARGTYPVTLGLNVNDVEPMEQDGLPVKLLGTLDGAGYVTGGFSVLGLFNQAPHPNAAKLFVNWIASPEGQQVHAGAEKQAPMRRDVPAPWLREHQIPKEGVSYLRLYDYQYVTEQKPAILRRFRELLGS
ncbi:MAG TPA: extracellular solute-binding protein [Chloroflexota bacterium]